MRITYIHQYFNTPEMSGGTRSYEMARRLVMRGHNVSMITTSREASEKPHLWYRTVVDGIDVHWLPVPYTNSMSYRERIRAFSAFSWKAAFEATSIPTDLVFATSTPLTVALPGIYAAKRHGVPFVFEVRDLWPEIPIAVGALRNPVLRYSAQALERWAYKHASAIIALSPGMKAGIVDTGILSEKVTVIPNGCDIDRFGVEDCSGADFLQARPWLKNRPILVYCGTFGRMNALHYLVDLAAALININSPVCLLLIGDGAEKMAVMEKARLNDVLDKNFFVESNVPKSVVPQVLRIASAAVSCFNDIPAMRHNSANKFFDSLAAGRAIVLNYGGWHNDIVTRHRCGLSLHQKDIHEAAREVHEALTDESWVDQAGRSAKRVATEFFDRDVLGKQFIDVLEGAVKGVR
jgi:glycosyltransferase involved in cell wall biosynthesis